MINRRGKYSKIKQDKIVSEVGKQVMKAIGKLGLSLGEVEQLACLAEGSLREIMRGNRTITETQVRRLEEAIEEEIDRDKLEVASYYMR